MKKFFGILMVGLLAFSTSFAQSTSSPPSDFTAIVPATSQLKVTYELKEVQGITWVQYFRNFHTYKYKKNIPMYVVKCHHTVEWVDVG